MSPPSEQKPGDVPSDLPQDVKASYKPQSLEFANGSDDTLVRMMGRKHLNTWSVGYANEEVDSTSGERTVDLNAPGSKEFILKTPIGRGGFGEIWEATQVSLGRVIAVKRMRQDLFESSIATDSTCRQVELSFHQEALTAANLDHPNIVPVYDLGRDDKGRTMLAMKRVRGKPWEEMLDEDRKELSEPDFLAKHIPILVDVAQAVAFAHSRGIIHRDIKPGQVMVGEFGEVLLMDWGLAVVFDEKKAKTEGSVFLSYGVTPTSDRATSPAGTVAFMAPEQTEKSAENIGPWTDLFLLGGTLFFILTNTVPHTASGNVGAFFKAMKGETEPPKVRAPQKFIPQELNDLCSWSMNGDRIKRLSSAKVFVEALQNYIGGASRKEESNRLADEAEEMLKAAQGYDDLGRAEQAAEQATGLWIRNPRCETILQEIDRRFAELALGNNDLVLARVHIMRLREGEGRDRLLRRHEAKSESLRLSARQRKFFRVLSAVFLVVMLAGGVMYYLQQMRSRDELMEASIEMRDERDAANKAREAAAVSREQAESLVNFLVGDLSRDLAAMGRADVMNEVTGHVLSYYDQRSPESRAMESVSTRRNRGLALQLAGTVQLAQGRPGRALEFFLESEKQAEELIAELPDESAPRYDLARSLLGKVQVFQLQKNLNQGLDSARRAAEILGSLSQIEPENTSYSHGLGRAHYFISAIMQELGDTQGALPHFRHSQEIFRSLVALQPENMEFRESLAFAYRTASVLLWSTGEIGEAAQLQRETTKLWQELALAEPWNVKLPEYIAESHMLTGVLLNEMGEIEESRESYREAVQLFEQLTDRDEESSAHRLSLARALNLKGDTVRQQGDSKFASELHDQAMVLLHGLLEQDESNAVANFELARTLTLRGMARHESDVEGAVRQWDRALGLYAGLTNGEQQTSDFLDWHARTHMLMGNLDEARAILKELAARNHRRRELFEMASIRGLVDDDAKGFELRLK